MLKTREPMGTIVIVVETDCHGQRRATRRAIFPGSAEEFACHMFGKDGSKRLLLEDEGYILRPNSNQFVREGDHLRFQYLVPTNRPEWNVILPMTWELGQEKPHFLLQPLIIFPTMEMIPAEKIPATRRRSPLNVV